MGYLSRPTGLIFLLMMILLGVQGAFKKPLCIDSSIVYKIDNIDVQKTETIYACKLLKTVKYSNFFNENRDALESRLSRFASALGGLARGDNRYSLTINNIEKDNLTLEKNNLNIGINLLNSTKLETSLFQIILSDKFAIQDEVYLQSLADFIFNEKVFQNLISEAFRNSTELMSLSEKRQLKYFILKSMSEAVSRNESAAQNKLKNLLLQSSNLKALEKFNQQLISYGYLQDSDYRNYKFDVIIETEDFDFLKNKELFLKNVNLNTKVGILNAHGLFVLPSGLRVPDRFKNNLSAQYRVVFGLDQKKSGSFLKYMNNTEKLILINSKTKILMSDWKTLLGGEIKRFLAKNTQLNFVQLHMPSYKLMFESLNKISNYFEFVQTQSLSKSEFKAIGWRETLWSPDLQAYKVNSNFDVIQYFRVN